MEAQRLITLSINKIAGSRRQRGGINLRKNLLVASVLHSARIHYYEEMCNRMPGQIALEQSRPEPAMDDDCTESPDWDSDEETSQTEEAYEEESGAEDSEIARNSCEQSENTPASCRVVVEQHYVADKENVDPSGLCYHKTSTTVKEESSGYHSCSSLDAERIALNNVTTHQSQNSSSVETCTTTTCLTISSSKRKRTESEEACGEPTITKRVKVDSQCQTTPNCGPQSSISSLVDIFKAGFHGLSGGEGGSKLVSYVDEKDSSSQSSSPSYTTLTSHSRPFESLQVQTAVIAAC